MEHLPLQSELVNLASSHVDLWQGLKEIVAESTSERSSLEATQAIFDYAWWCIDKSNDSYMTAAIETFFYEDLPAYSDTCDKIKHFVNQQQFARLRESLSARISVEEFENLFAEFCK